MNYLDTKSFSLQNARMVFKPDKEADTWLKIGDRDEFSMRLRSRAAVRKMRLKNIKINAKTAKGIANQGKTITIRITVMKMSSMF